MAGRFIDKEHGTDSSTAITDSASNRRKVRNLLDAAGLVYDRVAHLLKYNGNDAIKVIVSEDGTQTLTNKTLTSPVITGATGAVTSEIVTATNVISASESGTTFFLNSATEFDSTLPAPAQGLFYRFIVTDAPETASYTVTTNAAAQILAGQVFSSTGGDADSETAATATTITFVDGVSVIGDMAEVWSDGTSWFARCHCNADAGITITG